VDRAIRSWTEEQVKRRPEIVGLGYFGSYARGDWGVGSDLDLIAVVKKASKSFERRSAEWDLNDLPVPAEILVYTPAEWEALSRRGSRFARMLNKEVVWTYKVL
jgi:predicted nucleotidyltransferase